MCVCNTSLSLYMYICILYIIVYYIILCYSRIVYHIILHFLRGSSVKIGTIQRRLAWPLRKDDTHKSRSVNSISFHIAFH